MCSVYGINLICLTQHTSWNFDSNRIVHLHKFMHSELLHFHSRANSVPIIAYYAANILIVLGIVDQRVMPGSKYSWRNAVGKATELAYVITWVLMIKQNMYIFTPNIISNHDITIYYVTNIPEYVWNRSVLVTFWVTCCLILTATLAIRSHSVGPVVE